MNNKTVDILFILYRLFFMLVSVYIISNFTKLGDYDRYIASDFMDSFVKFIGSPNDTYMTDVIISGLKKLFLGNIMFANIIINVISSLAIVRLIRKMRYNIIFMILCLSPSFSIWSSFASKEIIVVTFMALMLSEVIAFLRDEKVNYLFAALAVFMLLFYKLQLVLPVLQLLLSVVILKRSNQHSGVVIIPLILVVNVLGIFIMRDYVDDLVRSIIVHFSSASRSTRDSTFLMQNYGFFLNLPYGMFITFFGPTLGEISTSTLHLFTAIESTLIIGTLVYLFIFKSKKFIKPDFIHVMVFINLLLLLMFFQTPWGILNPGSAIRYRADYYLYILVLFYLYREDFFILKSGEHNE